ncbi:1-acyl-sn-glycerol-3-phosphate acyltransferase [Nocardia sp. 348MFTsu5.1]|uniref:lysophospholipid acyltransferase family protein n=1 Tax=Nocardia sp. 348MFTsu5.1 TaxID=1172185 RepID=UPI00035DFBAA|nr:lysophospholipid acyltransferase family protein [Nocardia sp. 348MFTsu5.1]
MTTAATTVMTTAGTPGAVAVPDRHSWFPVSGCDTSCVRPGQHRAGRIRRGRRMVALPLTIGWVLAIGVMVTAAPRRFRAAYLRFAARRLLAALGLRLDIDRGVGGSGAVDGGAAGGLIVANHISFLDILAVAAVSPAHFVAKSEVIAWPVIGLVTRSIGVIGLRRESLRELPAAVDAVRADLVAGDSVGVFPEGTTWCGRGGGRFRPAFFQAAIDAQVPVRPMVVSFHTSTGDISTEPCFIGADSIGDTLRRVMLAKGLTVRVQLRELQFSDGDRRELAARCERIVFGVPDLIDRRGTAGVALAA